MTSIHCPECSTLVSGSDQNCPQCNFPVSKLRGLSAAILTKNAERVAGLIQLGADVNAVDKNGRTPLITAALIDDEEIVQMLLAAGARPQFVNKAGETALSVAKSRDVERLIRRAIVVSKFQRVHQTEPPTPPPVPVTVQVQDQPAIQFDHSIMLTEIPPPQQINRVTPIDVQLNEELFELQNHRVQEEPQIEFDHSIMFTEIPPTQPDQVMPIDVQMNDELFDSVQNYTPVEEQPIEEPPIYEEAILAKEPIYEEPVVVEEPIYEEPIVVEQPIYQDPIVVDQKVMRSEGPKYFFAAVIGCCMLLIFMGLTWPRYTRTFIPRVAENPKPVRQITKPEPEEQQPVAINEVEVTQEPQPPDPIPEPPAKKIVTESSRKAKPVRDREKIRLAHALNSQGYSLIQQGKPGDAIPVLERSLQSFPKDTKDPYYGYALYNLAVAWRKAGRPDLAIPILEKRMKIEDQRNLVARELYATRQEAKNAGFGSFRN
jgi:tetratricopeptide (TPR) repeat protein